MKILSWKTLLFSALLVVVTACGTISNSNISATKPTPKPVESLACQSKVASQALKNPNVTSENPFFYIGFSASPSISGNMSLCAKWTIPHVSCPGSTATFPAWIGFISNGGDIIQIGTKYRCDQQRWFYWYELGPSYVAFPGVGPTPGTMITASIVYDHGSSQYTLIINQDKKIVHRNTVPVSANIIIEPDEIGNGQQTALANYGSVTFFNCVLNGNPFFSYPVVHWKKKSDNLFNAQDTVTSTDSFTSKFLNP